MLAALALTVLAGVLAGCDSRTPQTPLASPVTTLEPPTTSAASGLQPPLTTHRDGTRSGRVDGIFLVADAASERDGGCRPQEVLGILQELTGAIASDPALAASFAKDDFQWYSATENGNKVVRRRHDAVYDAADFRAYLERRRRQREQLRLIALRARNDGNFEVRLVRVAEDLAPAQGGRYKVAEGKGKVNCGQRSLIAFSHAMFPVEPAYGTWRARFGNVSAKEFERAAGAAFAALRRRP